MALTRKPLMQGTTTRLTQRGEATRSRILKIARERFASEGFERATIRSIARDAVVDPALVVRYFGSKDELLMAAVEFELHLPSLQEVPIDHIGSVIVEDFLDRWENDETWQALLRVAATNEKAAERLRQISSSQTLPFVQNICGDPSSAPTRNNLINSLFWGFAMAKYILKLPEIVKLRRTDVVRWLGPVIHHYLFDNKDNNS